MITKEQLLKIKGWHYAYISSHEVMKMSGWKFYIFGETVEDSYDIYLLLTPIAKKYNVTMKIASQHVIDRNTKMDICPAWSVGVIYLHPEVFQENRMPNLVDDIKQSLKDYKRTGEVKGAKSVDGKIHYRYDLKEPVEPAVGVMYANYLDMYRGEHGEFNIVENGDITKYLTS